MSEGQSASDEAPIVAFFRGGKDASGRTLDEILAWDDERLEEVHDYVQWVFPTTRPSDFNRSAPVLDESTIGLFRSDPVLRERLVGALRRMLRFYGFELSVEHDRPVVKRAANWPERRSEWLHPGDHNLLRITRILSSLSTLGLAEHAQAFLRTLEALEKGNDARGIEPRTFNFWRAAVIATS